MEYEPYHIANTLPVLRVSDHASHGLKLHVTAGEDFGNLRDDIIDEIEGKDIVLHEAIDEMINGWKIEEQTDRDRFADGFAIAYKLLAFQSEIAQHELPTLEEETAEAFKVTMSIEKIWEKEGGYLLHRLSYLNKHGFNFMSSLAEYISLLDLNENDKLYFVLGAISVHDMIVQQTYANAVVEAYSRSN